MKQAAIGSIAVGIFLNEVDKRIDRRLEIAHLIVGPAQVVETRQSVFTRAIIINKTLRSVDDVLKILCLKMRLDKTTVCQSLQFFASGSINNSLKRVDGLPIRTIGKHKVFTFSALIISRKVRVICKPLVVGVAHLVEGRFLYGVKLFTHRHLYRLCIEHATPYSRNSAVLIYSLVVRTFGIKALSLRKGSDQLLLCRRTK